MTFSKILTHPGGSHKDEFLACCLLLAKIPSPSSAASRPTPTSPTSPPPSSMSATNTTRSGGISTTTNSPKTTRRPVRSAWSCNTSTFYDDARKFCDWLEPAEWFDTRGPVETARWLGVERETLFKLNSPIDTTLLRRFAAVTELNPGEPLWEIMRWIGEDLLSYLRNLRERLNYIGDVGEFWEIETPKGPFKVLFMPRTEPMPDEPSSELARFIESHPDAADVAGLVYPDRRGVGFGLSRHNDHPGAGFHAD